LAQLFAGKRRTVITYHSDIVKQRTLLRLYDPFLRRTLARADRIIAASPNYVQSSPYLRRVAEKCRIVPYGVDGARFAHPEPLAVTALRQKYGEPLVLFVGLFRYYKGLTYLVEAMRDVPAHLVLVGAGPLDGELREQVRRDRLDDKVHFAGVVADNDLPSFYHACDVFVLPSSQRSEAFGISQIEAMCCAKPIVCTELGTGTSFVNVDGETGFVVPPRDPLALAAALTKLLTDNELRGRMGHAARRRAAEQFSKEDMIERTEAVYREVLERG
jgi:rhamnosyl/mannosyltransferase